MFNQLISLVSLAAFLGLIHTLIGPDHYLPFIALSKAQNFSKKKTILITAFCGAGHILFSVALAFIGSSLTLSLKKIQIIHSIQSEFLAWGLISFGLIYLFYGLRKLYQRQERRDDVFFQKVRGFCWLLFVLFIFGPCEPLIPLLMHPMIAQNIYHKIFIGSIFGMTMLITMITIVFVASFELSYPKFLQFERFKHVLAGLVILSCGLGIRFLGL